jgi:hypothetical protein
VDQHQEDQGEAQAQLEDPEKSCDYSHGDRIVGEGFTDGTRWGRIRSLSVGRPIG